MASRFRPRRVRDHQKKRQGQGKPEHGGMGEDEEPAVPLPNIPLPVLLELVQGQSVRVRMALSKLRSDFQRSRNRPSPLSPLSRIRYSTAVAERR